MADTMNESEARKTMLDVAAMYDRMADNEEKKDGPSN